VTATASATAIVKGTTSSTAASTDKQRINVATSRNRERSISRERVNLVRLTVNTVRTITREGSFGSAASDYGCGWLAG